MFLTDTYIIRAISNLHAGSGDADFGIVDKHVQRDPVTLLPTIFASSIKGALRQHLETSSNYKSKVGLIFGSDTKSNQLEQGSYRFFDAHLLAIPVRSDHNFFYLATCPELIKDFLSHLKRHGDARYEEQNSKLSPLASLTIEKGKPRYLKKESRSIYLEDFKAEPVSLEEDAVNAIFSILGNEVDRLAIFHCDDFHQLCQTLPTVARNQLDNGISANLWYEEIVPRESRFYCGISRPEKLQSDDLANALDEEQNLVQIGANATVGYGLCNMAKF